MGRLSFCSGCSLVCVRCCAAIEQDTVSHVQTPGYLAVNGSVPVVLISVRNEVLPNTLNLCKATWKVRKVMGVTEETCKGRGIVDLIIYYVPCLLQPIKVKVEF